MTTQVSENGDYGYTLSMLYLYFFVSVIPNFLPDPYFLISLLAIPILIVMWAMRKNDSAVDHHGRELIRSTIIYLIYMIILAFLGGVVGMLMTGNQYQGALVAMIPVGIFSIFVFVNMIRQLIAAHNNREFVYPYTFSPRR